MPTPNCAYHHEPNMLKRFMHNAIQRSFLLFCAASLFLARSASAASVGSTGYTNSFDTQPLAEDWATVSRSGAQADNYDLDVDVNGNTAAIIVTNRPASDVNDP